MTMLSSRGSESFESRRDWHVPTPTTSVDQQQSSYELQPINSSDNDRDIKASWHSLFAFTTRQHAASLVFAGLATIGAGILKPISAIFFGNIFSALTKFGAGTLNGQETLEQISIWCIALVALGGGTWFFEGALLSTWMVFGELQAKSVREQMFTGMLKKDMEWYDLREDGIGSLLIRIQT
jgi:ATP-binding cassette subfamily B (MDR/TAP) protein 1